MTKFISRYQELSDFLKTRRAKISPAQVGLPVGSHRRTPGLRREEVASLAGIGITWYTWLEQGREIQVSAQVLESLRRVLMLNAEETRHLYTLAHQVAPMDIPAQQQTVSPMLQRMLDSLAHSPALILDTRWNLVAWNNAARIVLIDFDTIKAEDRNCVWLMFTNSEYKKKFTEWDKQAQGLVARFRAEYSKYIEDPWVIEFVEKLKRKSPDFTKWWSMHNVEHEEGNYKTFNHPKAGKLIFEHTSFFVADNMNLKLFINAPAPNTDTEDKIKNLLSSL